MDTPLYDAFSDDYDRFVDWSDRLAHELPYIELQLAAVNAERILDVACGTGMHAIALAEHGYRVTGADLSVGMIERARANAAAVGQEDIPFYAAGFGQMAQQVGSGYDAVLCLGSSLPHLLNQNDLEAALADFAAVLRPGGLLLIQNRNFDAVLAGRNRWMGPQAHRDDGREWLFVRFYDFNTDGTLTFNVATLRRDGEGAWMQGVEATRLRPWPSSELAEAVGLAGFDVIAAYGHMSGKPFDPATSDNLILTALLLGNE
jgi:SAM-dependent methyltransferase